MIFNSIPKPILYSIKIISIDDSLKQPIVTIKNIKNQFLIPLHKDIIIKLDRSKKELLLNLAEGLENLNS